VISGAHSIIYSAKADADRAFFRDVLGLSHVDVGGGWLIFGLPPAEVAVHPSDGEDKHELYLMCDDIEAFVGKMKAHQIACTPVSNQGWGLLTELTLPGGGSIGVYQPRHARPAAASASKPRRKTARSKRTAKRPARRTKARRKSRARG
jgi:catechol 2,3-dioxygenase-like lactoylglutathione lyase family enzyme